MRGTLDSVGQLNVLVGGPWVAARMIVAEHERRGDHIERGAQHVALLDDGAMSPSRQSMRTPRTPWWASSDVIPSSSRTR
ncbi:hypothetical protein [Sorangium sp. So ce1099]|uniref:hypothetical protein n=1 Tax=Sorangium sp. So ce1099 TaxID=3133331 RepID=UPI003F60B69A